MLRVLILSYPFQSYHMNYFLSLSLSQQYYTYAITSGISRREIEVIILLSFRLF